MCGGVDVCVCVCVCQCAGVGVDRLCAEVFEEVVSTAWEGRAYRARHEERSMQQRDINVAQENNSEQHTSDRISIHACLRRHWWRSPCRAGAQYHIDPICHSAAVPPCNPNASSDEAPTQSRNQGTIRYTFGILAPFRTLSATLPDPGVQSERDASHMRETNTKCER